MYSAKSYQLTQSEFNYLLPILRNDLLESNNKYYFIAYNIDHLIDMLNRLKGLYDNYNDLKNMIAYNCSKKGNLELFRESINVIIHN